jgi:hypothetical protein
MVRTAEDQRLAISDRLIGRLDEYHLLLGLLVERPGLTTVSSDPWSGASQILDAVAEHFDGACVVVDARACSDPLDLAMTIAEKAIVTFDQEAAAWWIERAPVASAAGLRLARKLSARQIDIEDLRLGHGTWADRIADAVALLLTLSNGPVTLILDHVGLLLSALSADQARELLGLFRSLRQRHSELDLVLVEHPDGIVAKALSSPEHPLFRAGQQFPLRRPKPVRYALDLQTIGLQDDSRFAMLPAAAGLARGVPALAWRIAELAGPGETVSERAFDGWVRLQRIAEPSVAREWDLLRRVHPLAQPVVAAVACGLGPHAVHANSKSVTDALRRLRDLGMAWQPGARTWMLADPLLAAWAQAHAPSWVRHRRQMPPG